MEMNPLKKSLPRLKDQIALRARSYEANIPEEYLSNLNKYYNEWMDRYDLGKKLVIDSDQMDFVKNSDHFDQIAHQIIQALDQRDLFLEARAKAV